MNRLLAWVLPGCLSVVTGLAQTRSFELGGQTLELDDLTPEMAVFFRAFRPT